MAQKHAFEPIAAGSVDGKRIVIKAVNYEGNRNTLLARLQGSAVPANAQVKVYTVKAELMDARPWRTRIGSDPLKARCPTRGT